MKAFTIYLKKERDIRILLDRMQKYGHCNCDFDTFCTIYDEWHLSYFPGRPITTGSANFRNDWFADFVSYIAQKEI